MNDPYATLGVQRDASPDAIRKAFHKLARTWHPDVNKSPNAKNRFKAINAAHDIVGDEAKRKLWDEFGEASLRPGFDPDHMRHAHSTGPQGVGGFDVEDLFSSLFGGGAQRRPRGPEKGADHTADLSVDFLTAVRGGLQTLRISTHDGQARTYRVPIPPGASHGGKVRLKGKGGASTSGGPPGDLIVNIRVKDHPWLSRSANDLHASVPITVLEAMQGAQIKLTTPWGDVKLAVPKNTLIPTKVRLKGKGVRKKKASGDLIATLVPTLPKTTDESAAEAAKVLEEAYAYGLRDHLNL